MKIKINNSEVNLPDFLIAGAAKSGTTSLYYYLKQHPDVFMPDVKEPSFFIFFGEKPSNDFFKSVTWNEREYLKLFAERQEAAIGEASVDYMIAHRETIANIRAMYGERYREIRIIFILRNPIERVWSHYNMYCRDKYETLTFHQAIDAIEERRADGYRFAYDYFGYGMYSEQLEAFIRAFDNVKVVLYDDFTTNPAGTCEHLFDFLGVKTNYTPDISRKMNVSGKVKLGRLHQILFLRESWVKTIARKLIPYDLLQFIKYRLMRLYIKPSPVPDEIRKQLVTFYKEDILKTSKIIGRDLQHWLG